MKTMTKWIVFVWCCTAAMPVAAESNSVPGFTLEQVVQTRTLGQFAISPDGTKVAYAISGYYLGFPLIPRFGEENNIRVVSLESGEIVQVTSGPVPKTNPVFSPSGDRIAFESENDIWVVDLKTGAAKRLTMSMAGVRARAAAWSPDGTRLVFVSNRKGKTDLWIVSTEGERQGIVQLTNDDAGEDDPDWSPDGRTIAFAAKRSSEYYMATGIYVVPSTGGPATRLTPPDTTDNFAPRWSPDGTQLAILSDRSGYVHVWTLTLADKSWRGFDTGNADSMSPYWAVRPVWSHDGKRLLVSSNRLGSFELAILDVATGRAQAVGSGAGAYHEVGWSRGDGSIVYVWENAWSPPDLYVRPADGTKARRLTHSSGAYFSKDSTAAMKRVSMRSADGFEIYGYLLTPPAMPQNARLPAIVEFHPNSYGQFYFDNWNPFPHYLAQHGYAVLMVNQRAGSGYGRAFREPKKNVGNWGANALDDVTAAAAFIKSQPFVDPARVGAMGLSMGGYLTLLSLTKAPDLFSAGVDLMGPTDLRRPFTPYQVNVDQDENPELFDRISPITSVKSLRVPLLILHSDQDRNVVPQETYHLIDELERQNKPYEAKFYPGEAHGLADPAHALDSYQRMVWFFDRYLKP
jgi:dipeptidyl aminopeptidase/acylaminoacyl peptidase